MTPLVLLGFVLRAILLIASLVGAVVATRNLHEASLDLGSASRSGVLRLYTMAFWVRNALAAIFAAHICSIAAWILAIVRAMTEPLDSADNATIGSLITTVLLIAVQLALTYSSIATYRARPSR